MNFYHTAILYNFLTFLNLHSLQHCTSFLFFIHLQSISLQTSQMLQNQEHAPQPNTFPVFSKDFLLKPQVVLDHSNKSRKQMQDFIYAFIRRMDIELTYQKNLTECSKIMEKYIEPNTEKCLSYISSAFKADNEQRGTQAKELAESLRIEIIEPLTQMLKNYTNLIKKAQKNFKKLNKDYSYLSGNYKKSKENFEQNDEEAKEMIITKNIYKFTYQHPQDKKTKLISKISQSIKQKVEYEKHYQIAVSQLNEFVELYQKQATQMLDELQNAQRQQIKLERDAIRKLIVSQVSMFKNVEYDIINISKQMEKMYAETDIQTFKRQAINVIVENEKEQVKEISLKTFELQKSLIQLSLRSVEEEYYAWLLSIKKNKELRKIMELRMKELNPQIHRKYSNGQISIKTEQEIKNVSENQQKIEENSQLSIGKQIQTQWSNLPKIFFDPPPNPNGIPQNIVPELVYTDFLSLTSLINNIWAGGQTITHENRSNFINLIQSSHLLRILGYLYIEEYRIEHQVLMNWENYEKAGDLLKILIQRCEKFGDVFTLKGILALIFTFYSAKDQKTKKLLFQVSSVSQCQVWKRNDYWQASIFQSTYQQMALLSSQKGETQSQTLLRQKNIIFSQLASYCHYMLMLGIPNKSVRRIVGRYCRLYGMSDDQNKDLSRMILNTVRQVKENNPTNTQISAPPNFSIVQT